MFLGKSVGNEKDCSQQTAYLIDQEVRKIIDKNYERARKILSENMDKLHTMSDALMKYETIDADQIKQIMQNEEVTPPKDWEPSKKKPVSSSSDGNNSSDESVFDDTLPETS